MLHPIAQWHETTWRNSIGKVSQRRCNCPRKIPGLDATACRRCQVWWVDQQQRLALLPQLGRKRHHSSLPPLGDEWWDGQL